MKTIYLSDLLKREKAVNYSIKDNIDKFGNTVYHVILWKKGGKTIELNIGPHVYLSHF